MVCPLRLVVCGCVSWCVVFPLSDCPPSHFLPFPPEVDYVAVNLISKIVTVSGAVTAERLLPAIAAAGRRVYPRLRRPCLAHHCYRCAAAPVVPACRRHTSPPHARTPDPCRSFVARPAPAPAASEEHAPRVVRLRAEGMVCNGCRAKAAWRRGTGASRGASLHAPTCEQVERAVRMVGGVEGVVRHSLETSFLDLS